MTIETIKELVDYGTLGILGLMGFIVLFLTIERLLTFRKFDLGGFDSLKALEIELTRNLSAIATIGANAPYVGLLGTVGGIIITFYTIGQDGLGDTKEIMVGLALALKATALGLIVAIPSMIVYNLLIRRAEVLSALWEIEQERKTDA